MWPFTRKSHKQSGSQQFVECASSILNSSDFQDTKSTPFPDYIMDRINRLAAQSKAELDRAPSDTDFTLLAVKYIYMISSRAVDSGELHVYRGMLNPVGPGPYLLFICERCLRFMVNVGEMDEATMADQLDIIHDNIASVG